MACSLLAVFFKSKKCVVQTRSRYGQRTKDSKNLLQEAEQAHDFQSHPVQGWQGFPLRSGKTSLRQKTVRIRRTDQTRLPQEGQNHQKDRSPTRVHQGTQPLAGNIGSEMRMKNEIFGEHRGVSQVLLN